MRIAVRTMTQGVLLLAISFALGLAVNAARGKNRIDLGRNYVPRITPTTTAPGAPADPYCAVTLDEVVASVSTRLRGGLDVLIDARTEDAFARGHIDGALHCDPYRLDECIDRTLEAAAGAERVIVYCHGGTCEDSYLLCGELVVRGLAAESLFVFKGGWEAWEKHVQNSAAGNTPPTPASENAADGRPREPAVDAKTAGAAAEPTSTEGPPPQPPVVGAHGFQELSLDEVVALYEHANTGAGLHLFIDARDDEAFSRGHIPGAIQCDFYRIDYYFPEVLARAPAAEKIIVYCNGGECEDSLYVCGELLKADVPRARVLLFRGGWEEWRSREDLPIETGDGEQ